MGLSFSVFLYHASYSLLFMKKTPHVWSNMGISQCAVIKLNPPMTFLCPLLLLNLGCGSKIFRTRRNLELMLLLGLDPTPRSSIHSSWRRHSSVNCLLRLCTPAASSLKQQSLFLKEARTFQFTKNKSQTRLQSTHRFQALK
jgi:hypothetical protein